MAEVIQNSGKTLCKPALSAITEANLEIIDDDLVELLKEDLDG